ncbi:hypothetical protein CHRY9293_03694 [Chryseobacterium potabilaquae]|uniref:Uncharacterized protein n=1 Tax=Chryseobacterium potabilaquae TaxID=2675057 RepID=A0A6N4XBE9_9FLAO|nr:hypothetical protein CHRY9293_03694 [Chryseobacterium potabilaquae]
MANDPLFFTMFNASITEPLANFIEHKIMFNDYKKLGYMDYLFIMDYFEKK